MIGQYFELIDAIDGGLSAPPSDLNSALASLPAVGNLPDPWATWTLFGLVAYGRRKRRAWGAVRRRLAPECRRQGVPLGDLGYDGPLPGLPGWRCELEGNASFVIHEATGESIHLDLLNGPGDLDGLRFVRYLRDHRRPGPAARRLLELHRGARAVPVTLRRLLDGGLLHEIDWPDSGEWMDFELCGVVTDREQSIARFLDAWGKADPATRVWLASLVGDWPGARDAARSLGDPALLGLTEERAGECLSEYQAGLRAAVEESGLDADLLHALADAGAGELPGYYAVALDHPGDLTEATLERIADDPGHVAAVERLVGAIPAAAGRSADHLLLPCVEYLGRHGRCSGGLIETLAGPPAREVGAAAILALEHAPELAPDLLRRALRRFHFCDSLTVAAALALVDRPWSRAELRAVLDESDDTDATHACRTALRTSLDPAARRAADEWEERQPGYEEAGLTILSGSRSRCQWLMAARMDELRERILAIRDRLPDEGFGPAGGGL